MGATWRTLYARRAIRCPRTIFDVNVNTQGKLRMQKVSSAITPIIAIDRKASRPLHRQIYDGYRAGIVNGALQPGQRVPSTRGLALELGISRIPVLTAYAQLVAEGYLQSRTGTGTAVSVLLPHQGRSSERRSAPAVRRNLVTAVMPPLPLDPVENPPWSRGWGPFGVGQVAFDQFPFQVWSRLVTRHCRNTTTKSLDYGNPMGLEELREAIAVYLRTVRGVRCEAEQIMIVSGSQQALHVAVRALLKPESRIWMEEPGYRFARRVFAVNGCRIVPVPVDHEGLNVAAGLKRCQDAHAAFVTPSHQYPLGFTMSASRRLQLLDWAEHSRAWIFEDDYDSDYRYENMPILSLQGLDRNARVVYIGTFSKVLFPSLRLGYLVIPEDLIGRFQAVRFAAELAPATFFQLVLTDFIREGHFSRHIRRMRMIYHERRTALVSSIGDDLGFGFEITGAQAGMHLCIIRDGLPDREIAQRASSSKIWVVPLSPFYTGNASRQGFVLGFGSTAASEMSRALQKFQSVLRPSLKIPR
jgi:GntR family transcriptional regulator / MocR family aminotransferase